MKETQQWEQLQDTLNGEQNFCIIEERKAPILYAVLLQIKKIDGIPVTHRNGKEGPEVIVGNGYYVQKYLELLSDRPKYTRADFQVQMGLLLGYSFEDCVEFAKNPPDCDCEKCGGPNDRIELGPVEYEGTRPYQKATYQGAAYGTLYHPDPELIKHSPGIQNWSKP